MQDLVVRKWRRCAEALTQTYAILTGNGLQTAALSECRVVTCSELMVIVDRILQRERGCEQCHTSSANAADPHEVNVDTTRHQRRSIVYVTASQSLIFHMRTTVTPCKGERFAYVAARVASLTGHGCAARPMRHHFPIVQPRLAQF